MPTLTFGTLYVFFVISHARRRIEYVNVTAHGAFNGAERGQALDLLGFRRQVIFSSFCGGLIFRAADDTVAYATAAVDHAYRV